MPIKLKPCPFCGGEAVYVQLYSDGKKESRGYVKCKASPSCCEQTIVTIRETVCEKWNRRVAECTKN